MSTGEGSLDFEDLLRLLGDEVDEQTARDELAGAIGCLGLSGKAFDRAQVVAVLEFLTERDGVIAVVARFAKVRALLALGSQGASR